jgi:conjugal transfer ATP-binding protein TraC
MTFLNKIGQTLADFFGERTDLDALAQGKEFTSDFLDPDYLADLLPYRLYDEEHKIYENKSSLGFVIEVVPLLGAGESVQKELSALMREIGDEGSSIQCLCWADYRIDRFFDLWSRPRRSKGGIFDEIARKKLEFFKKESVSSESPPRIFRFLFSYSEPKGGQEGLTLAINRLREKRTKALETLNRLSHKSAFGVEPLQLIEFLSGIINFEKNPSFDCPRTWNRHTWLSKQIGNPGTAIKIQKDGLVFQGKDDKRFFKTYEVTDYPDQWIIGCMGELLGDFFNKSYRIPSPFYIQYGIHFPSQQKAETKLRSKAKILDHQIKFPSLVRMFPDMPREREEHLYVHRQLLEGEKFVETRLSCGLWADSHQHIQAESILTALFQKFGFKLKENHFVHLPDFLSSLPMAWGEETPYIKNLKRIRCFRTTMTSETGSIIPILGEWWGNSTQGMILMGRRGQISSWDPFAAQGNLNTVVIGPSGRGKSVFMQDIILNHLGQGGRAYVLDLGRSFEKLCHLLEGQYLEFSEKSRLDLNPFNFIDADGNMDTINSGIEMVASIIGTMAMPAHKIDKERADILHALVKKAWETYGSNASVDNIIEFLGQISFKSELMLGATESLREGLKKFSKTGTYANYFYGKHSVNFSNDLVVIETEELKNMADLQTVILQIFVLTISNQIFMGDRSRRCLICIDEAWDLLKSPQMQGFIESLARRLRKYNGALVIGTQGLKDFDQSPGARAAFDNSNWLAMLGNDNESINVLKKENIIPMDDFKEMAISSLRMEEGKYGEVFIYYKGNGFFSVNQLKLDPFSAMLYSTKPIEFQAVQELQKSGMKIEQAIDWLATNRSKYLLLIDKGQSVKEAIASLMPSTPTKGDPHVQK